MRERKTNPRTEAARRRAYQKRQAELFRTSWFARTFVATMGRLATPIYEWAFELMRDDLGRADRIADIGCGNGLMAYRCSRRLSGKTYALLDRSAAQLTAGRGLHRKMRRGNVVSTHVAPAESIPLSDASFDVVGSADPSVGSRDPALALMKLFGEGGLAYRSLEVFDRSASRLDMATRASLANQAVDAGAKFCIVVPDEDTAEFLTRRDGREPDRQAWILPSENAQYVESCTLDLSRLEPLIARPPSPADVAPVAACAGEKIHQAFVGSCAGGRLEDLAEAAEVLAGRKVAPGVRLVVTPASRAVYLEALREGVIESLVEAGALVTDSSCGACGGIDKGLLAADEACVSTSNRNFRGRMGHKNARIFLASAKTAAASAITGRITDPREIER